MDGFLMLIIWMISLAVFYFIIKAAVKNGVAEANQDLLESVLSIERKLSEK